MRTGDNSCWIKAGRGFLNGQDLRANLCCRTHEGMHLRFLQSRSTGGPGCSLQTNLTLIDQREPGTPIELFWLFPVFFPDSWFYTEMAIPPRFGPFRPLRRFHPVEGFSPRRGVPPHSSSFPRPSYPPQSSCLSPPRHLSLKPTLLPIKPCFSPEWYLHTSPDNCCICLMPLVALGCPD